MDESIFDVFGRSADANANVSAVDPQKERDKERMRKRREHAAGLLLQLASVRRAQEKQTAPAQGDGGGAEPLTEAGAESSDGEAPAQKKAKVSGRTVMGPYDRLDPTKQNEAPIEHSSTCAPRCIKA